MPSGQAPRGEETAGLQFEPPDHALPTPAHPAPPLTSAAPRLGAGHPCPAERPRDHSSHSAWNWGNGPHSPGGQTRRPAESQGCMLSRYHMRSPWRAGSRRGPSPWVCGHHGGRRHKAPASPDCLSPGGRHRAHVERLARVTCWHGSCWTQQRTRQREPAPHRAYTWCRKHAMSKWFIFFKLHIMICAIKDISHVLSQQQQCCWPGTSFPQISERQKAAEVSLVSLHSAQLRTRDSRHGQVLGEMTVFRYIQRQKE